MLKKSNFKKSRNHLEGYNESLQNGKQRPSVPDELCTRCPKCGDMLFTDDLARLYHVCPKCGHHLRMNARQRLELVCDPESFEEWDARLQSCDPLDFPGYPAKIKGSRLQTGECEAVVTGVCTIGGMRTAIFVMNSDFMMGSMGSVVGEKITRVFEKATVERLPVVGFTASGGARMQEGILSLMQMAKTSGAVKLHSEAGLLYVTVLTDPTTGGVTASFAMEGDILLSEPGASIAFAGARVIEQTLRQKLPAGFQTAEFLLKNGFLDAVIKRSKLKATLVQILRLHKEV